jgi:hypothetical protein
MTDVLIDQEQPFAVRRRLARVYAACSSQRAVDGLLLGLEDLRFEVRYHCARSLSVIHERLPVLHIDGQHVIRAVVREVTVSRSAWDSHRLLDGTDDSGQAGEDQPAGARHGQSLTHVFTLLSLILPSEPLRMAYRGLQTDDDQMRGTALEYLEGVLPAEIRERIWPFLDDRPPRAGHGRA